MPSGNMTDREAGRTGIRLPSSALEPVSTKEALNHFEPA